MPRRVRVVLCSRAGDLLGALPGFTISDPWWPEVCPVVDAIRDGFGTDVVVLRLLSAEPDTFNGGAVTYLAELVGDPPRDVTLGRVPPDLAGEDQPLRAAWARPGGIEATIAWADETLAAIGRPRVGRAVQVKSWNLSSILRVPTAAGDVWCKSVPSFLAHEGAILALVAAGEPALVPPLLGRDPTTGTVLLDDVPGEDDWDAPEPRLRTMVRTLVRLQARWADRTEELLSAGLPDWRSQTLPDRVDTLLSRSDVRTQLNGEERSALDAVASGLPHRLTELGDCGLPETLVHGDFHQGNWRFDGSSLVLLDWGDSGVGHPMLDLSAFAERIPDETRAGVRTTWVDAWRAERPDADPARAADVIAPVASLRRAVIYQGFLDGIEPSERHYHRADVPAWLRQALADVEAVAS
jgi:hypothetical protein